MRLSDFSPQNALLRLPAETAQLAAVRLPSGSPKASVSTPRAQRSSLVPDTQASPQPGVSLTSGASGTNRLGSSYSGRRPPPPACAPGAHRAPFPVNAPPPSHDFFGRISLCLRGLQNGKNRHGQDATSHTQASVSLTAEKPHPVSR